MEDIFIVSLRQQITQRFMNEIAFSGFLSGFATAYFALHAYQLFRRKNSSRLQMVVAVIFVQWALFNLKDFILTFPDYSNSTVQDCLTLIDGTALIGYTCFIYELIHPRWATWHKALLMLMAYVPFIVLYILWSDSMVIRCYMVCLFVAGTIIFLLWLWRARQYAMYIRENYSNIDEIDISWLGVVAVFFVGCQLIWVVISIVRHPLTDCLYYLSSIILWQITLEHILHTTFYDYVNSLRIEKKTLPLMEEHPEYTLERIASESGFQSISTFRRSFQKLKGVTPSEYRKINKL